MSQALYRKYRSRSLDEIVGQEHITSLLSAAIAADAVHHAYLLTGPRGVGKTSIARIIAHEINGLAYEADTSHLDIVEIDAASNNGVDDVRDLRERVHIAPTSAKKKVYIIDEVHMLSKPAFNALLKTLEEPPSHVVFILATTDIDKVPATIVSRVHRFNFRTITPAAAVKHLRMIAKGEQIDIDDEALELIARRGGGSFRDSIGLLDQVQTLGTTGKITAERITSVLGLATEGQLSDLLDASHGGDIKKLMDILADLEASGAAANVVAEQLIALITSSLSAQPERLTLIDRLLQVNASSLPQTQLLVALAANIAPVTNKHTPVKSAASAAPTPKTKPTKSDTKPPTDRKPPVSQTPGETPAQAALPADDNYQHKALLDSIDDVALTSLLKKSASQLQGNSLTLYAGSKFNARQLDTADRRQKLADALSKLGHHELDIVILPDSPPLSDSQSAAVAAIMGGGEEVDL